MCQLHQCMNSEYYYNKMEFYITVSSKQKLYLVFRYFKYHVSRTVVSGDISWRCVKKTCSVYVKTDSSKTKLTKIKDSYT